MSVQTEIARIKAARSAIGEAVKTYGVDVPASTALDAMADKVLAIPKAGAGGVHYLYHASLPVDKWTATTGGYTQTASLLNASGTAESVSIVAVSPCMVPRTTNMDTNRILARNLGLVDRGKITFSGSTVTVVTAKKPACDLTVYWYINKE